MTELAELSGRQKSNLSRTLKTLERYGIVKLDAARRQLAAAIELWFIEGDSVSIHTLAYAASV